MSGKNLRLSRLFQSGNNKICIVPLDHGTTYGPIPGIREYLNMVDQVIKNDADAVIVHKGLLKQISLHKNLAKGRYMMHLSVSTAFGPDPSEKTLASSVEEALMLGADAVSVHVNLRCPAELKMIQDFGRVSGVAEQWGMPLLAMVYMANNAKDIEAYSHAVRLAEELGADMVKIGFNQAAESLEKVLKGVNIPVLIAGGPKEGKSEDLLRLIDSYLKVGASGIAVGRNVFQHPNPGLFTNLISRLVHGVISLEDCIDELHKKESNVLDNSLESLLYK